MDRPNILVIMSDQQSRNALGCYGNRIVHTPHIDGLAAQGLKFTNTYCAGPLCVPSRMSFMTSRTPARNRVWDNFHMLASSIPTWAHAVGAMGYETSLIGRMHFVGSDQRHGFENRPIGEFHAHHPGVSPGGGPPWTKFSKRACGQFRDGLEIVGHGTTLYQWHDEQITNAACEYLLARNSREQKRPFAAVVGLFLPHCPFIAPKSLFEHYYANVDIPTVEEHQPQTVVRYRKHRGLLEPPVTEKQVRAARAAYFALCEYHDSMVGKILNVLEESNLVENTLVIYCSDHGESAGEHGCWWKSNYYESSVGVPMIARWPGVTKEGSICSAICNLLDLGSTFAEIAGSKNFSHVDGRSLLPFLRAENPSTWINETYSEFVETKFTGNSNYPCRMIRSGPWKLWLYHDEEKLPPALFNLEKDPNELHDLHDDPACQQIKDDLLKKLHCNWNPEQVHIQALEATDNHQNISAWGAKTQPTCIDSLPYPPPELEKDIKLLNSK